MEATDASRLVCVVVGLRMSPRPENASSLAFVYPLDGIALSDDTGRDGLDELHKPGRGFRERLYALLPGAVKKKASAESSLILFGVGS